jgi:hypothetical protein
MFGLYYKPREISEINTKTDGKVAIVGKVVESKEDSFILDDGEVKAEINFEGKMKTNRMVKVFCSVAEDRLNADIVQNLDGLDLNLFKRVKELYNKAGV